MSLSTQSTSISGLGQLLNALHAIRTARSLTIDLTDVEHLYVTGLAVVAAWCINRKITPSITGATEATDMYLDRIGFSDAIAGRPHFGTHEDQKWRVALSPIAPSMEADDIAADCVNICDEHGFIGAGDKNALTITFAELIENVIRHSGAGSGLVAAQFYPLKRKVTVVVADTGKGIRQSFIDGDNPDARSRVEAGENYLRLATAPLVTSKLSGHAGYGLYVTRETTILNGGTFKITSGERSLSVFRKTDKMRTNSEKHQLWDGTIVSVLFDLDNLIPIGDVFSTMPIPGGSPEIDFFA